MDFGSSDTLWNCAWWMRLWGMIAAASPRLLSPALNCFFSRQSHQKNIQFINFEKTIWASMFNNATATSPYRWASPHTKAQGLERVSCICERRGINMPQNLIICGDNTVRELKNQFNFAYLAQLLGRRKMKLSAMLYLRKSHTHDRIDQLWGVISRRISCTDSLLTDEDTIQTIRSELSRPGVRSWIGSKCELHVEKMNCVRSLILTWLNLLHLISLYWNNCCPNQILKLTSKSFQYQYLVLVRHWGIGKTTGNPLEPKWRVAS